MTMTMSTRIRDQAAGGRRLEADRLAQSLSGTCLEPALVDPNVEEGPTLRSFFAVVDFSLSATVLSTR